MVSASKEINVLIVVDVEAALASRDLGSNVYLIDTNKYFGSGSEGQQELVTACSDGQYLIWSVVSVDPGADAELASFQGQMVDQKVCRPAQSTLVTGETVWSGRVESQGVSASFQYTCTLTFDGAPLTFDPFLNVTA